MTILYQNLPSVALRFTKGEELISLLTTYAKETNISFASFTLIGACSSVLLSYYNLDTKQYEDKEVKEDMEIVSVIGNISLKDNEPVIHSHGVFSKRDFSTIGGHLKSIMISGTGEVFLMVYPVQITREYDEDTGLFLLSNELQTSKTA